MSVIAYLTDQLNRECAKLVNENLALKSEKSSIESVAMFNSEACAMEKMANERLRDDLAKAMDEIDRLNALLAPQVKDSATIELSPPSVPITRRNPRNPIDDDVPF